MAIDRDFEAEKLCDPVEWSDFFDYAQRIHNKLIRAESKVKQIETQCLIPNSLDVVIVDLQDDEIPGRRFKTESLELLA